MAIISQVVRGALAHSYSMGNEDVIHAGDTAEIVPDDDRHAWVQVVRGRLMAAGDELEDGDGLAVAGIDTPEFAASETSDVLVFDLP